MPELDIFAGLEEPEETGEIGQPVSKPMATIEDETPMFRGLEEEPREDITAKRNLQLVVDDNPQNIAEAYKESLKTGLPIDITKTDHYKKANQDIFKGLDTASDNVKRLIGSDLTKAAVYKNDITQMSTIDRLINEDITISGTAKSIAIGLGLAGVDIVKSPVELHGLLSEYIEDQISVLDTPQQDIIREDLKRIENDLRIKQFSLGNISQKAHDWLTSKIGKTKYEQLIAEASRTIGLAVGAYIIGGEVVVNPLISTIAGVSKAKEARDSGHTSDKSFQAGFVSFGSEYLSNILPFHYFFGSPSKSYLSKLALGTLAEEPGELLSTAIEMYLVDEKILGKAPYTPFQYYQALWDTAIVALISSWGMVTATHPLQVAQDKVQEIVEKSAQEHARRIEIASQVDETEVKNISPELTAEAISQMDDDAEVYIENQFWQSGIEKAEDIVRKLGIDPKKALNNADIGQETAIKQAMLFSLLSQEERNIIMPYIKADLIDYSQNDLTNKVNEEDRSYVNEVFNEISEEEKKRNEAIAEQVNRLQDEITKAGRTELESQTDPILLEGIARRLFNEGKDPVEFLKGISFKKGVLAEFIKKGKKLFDIEVPESARGLLSVENERYVVNLFETADFSTVLHETGHIALQEYVNLEKTGDASESLITDLDILRDFVGIEKDQDFEREHTEQIARAWEAWLMEGKTPDPRLETFFERFKTWLKEIYNTVRRLNVDVTPEVRDVFNRMINADTDTGVSAAINGILEPSTQRMNELGILDEEQGFLKRLMKKAVNKASLSLLLDRNRAVRKSKAQFIEEAELEAVEADARGVYNIIDDMLEKTVTVEGQEFVKVLRGLNKQEFIELYGEDAIQKLPDQRILIKDGMSLDEAAVRYGFESGQELINAFFDTVPLQQAINYRVSQKIEQLENTFRPADYLANSKEYGDYVERMITHLREAERRKIAAEQRGVPRKIISREQIKQIAIERMNELSVTESQRVDKFLNFMKRAAINARKAERAGDYSKAIKESENLLINKEMAAIAVKNKRFVNDLVTRSKKFRSADKPATVALRFRKGIQSIIQRFGLLPNVKPQTEVTKDNLLELFKGDEFIGQHIAPDFVVDDNNIGKPRDYRKMRFADFKELDKAIKFLEKQGRYEHKATLSDGKTLLSEVGNGSIDEMDVQKPTRFYDRYNPIKKMSDVSRKFFARMLNINYITKALGGYKSIREGVKSHIEQYVIERLKDMRDAHLKLFLDLREEIKPHRDILMDAQRRMIKDYGRKLYTKDNGVPIPKLLQNNGTQIDYWTPEQIVAMAFNRGNDSNTNALINGFPGLTIVHIDSLLNRYMTPKEMDSVQAILDIFERLAPQTDAVHVKMKGYHMDRVQAREWRFQGKLYRGGYYPLTIDRNLATVANDFFTDKQKEADFFDEEDSVFNVPYAVATHTLTRVDGHNYPVDLRLIHIDKHIDKASRYITMAEGIRDVDRIITYSEKVRDEAGAIIGTRSFKQSAIRIMGKDVYDQIRPALRHFVNPVIKGLDTPGYGFARWLRSIAIPAHIALNTVTGVKQLASISSAIGEMGLGEGKGLRAYLRGVLYVIGNPMASYNEMLDKSSFMKERLKSWERDFLKQRFDRMTPAQREFSFGDKHITWHDVVDFGYITVRIPDTVAVTPIWWGAYLDKLNETGTNENEAIRYADNIIEDTQPIAQPLDLSSWLREGGYWSLFNLHQTFTVGNYGQRQRTWYRAFRKGEISAYQYARFNFFDAVAPIALLTLVTNYLRGGGVGEPEERKKLLEDFVAHYMFMGIPMASSLYNALTEGWQSPLEVAGAREIEKWTRTIRFLMRGFDDMNEKEKEKALIGVAQIISDISRVPFARVYEQIAQGETLKEKAFKPLKKKR